MVGRMEAAAGSIKVLIADDHAVVRNGLKMLLELEDDIVVAGEAADGRQAVEEANRISPDVVLMDLTMPELDGIEATKLLRETCPDAKVLVLTSIVEDSQILAAVRAGAIGYLLKEASPEEVSESVRAVHRGEPLLHPDAARSLMRELSQPSRVPEGTVTILFTDIEGSASVFDRLGDDAAPSAAPRPRQRRARGGRDARRRRGQAPGRRPDARLLERPPRAPVRCRHPGFDDRAQRRAPDNPLLVRIGLNTGDVISEDDDYFGSSVIAAARIADVAKGGEILLSEATKAVAGRIRVPLVDRGTHELRGLSETCRLYEAVWRPG